MIRLNRDDALEQLEAEYLNSPCECMMCSLVQTSDRSWRVAESEYGVVVLDGFAATEGHLLVIAKAHAESTAELEWPVYSDLQRLVWEASRTLEAVLRPSRVYVAALGSRANLKMSFPHYHVHVVPVYATDERARPAHVFSWSSGVVRYAEEEAAHLVRTIRGAWGTGAAPPPRESGAPFGTVGPAHPSSPGVAT